MLFTFIAVIVVILIIVGIMATGSSSGSGGINQTKATKVLSEISGLVQSVGFYKATTTAGDYENLSMTTADNAGVLPATTTVTTGADYNGPAAVDGSGDLTLADGATVIPSGSLSDLVFTVNVHKDGTGAVDNSKMDLNVFAKKTLDADLGAAINSAYGKLTVGATSIASNADTGVVIVTAD